ncbi:hypothetical protein [Nitrosophilus alvini]|uniref:hypothetical protein n=1 Tax=Nitrosophilus alvini TaxID=2714855 RepID=UPI0019098FC2|nr:hypothetical protein [Nitrosophilus alvini]
MYSESDFENFSRKILSSAKNRAEEILEEAREYARKKIENAQNEALATLNEAAIKLRKEAESFKKEEYTKLESELKIDWQLFLSDIKAAVLADTLKEIERNFEKMAGCFLKWLKEIYKEGNLTVYENLETEGFDNFNITKTPQKIVKFSKENIIIEFSPESVMEEFSVMIDEELSKHIEV